MTIWMLYAILFAGLAAAGALALERAARALRLSTRFIWLGALVVAIAGPVALPSLVKTERAPASSAPAMAVPVEPLGVVPGSTTRPALGVSGFARRLDQPLLLLWIAVTAICLGRFVLGMVAIRRSRRLWIAREIDGTPLLITPDLGPAVVAMPEPRIIVPEWVLALDRTSLATIIRHERQHTAAGDAWLIILGAVATSVVPWNPAVWFVRRRLRLALEVDCDARVLAEDPQVDRYGALLMQIAQHPRATASLSATLAESTSDLERRIDAMTASPSKFPRLRATAFAVAAVVAIMVAAALPAPALAVSRVSKPAPEAAPQIQVREQAEQSAVPAPGNPAPRYPDSLRARGVEGVVVAKFVVDTNGTIEPRTFEVIKADHPGFVDAVRDNLSSQRFVPASVGGRKVRQLVQMPFTFSLSRQTPKSTPTAKAPVTPAAPVPGPSRKRYEPPASDPTSQPGPPVASPSTGRERIFYVTPPNDSTPAQPLPTNVPPIYPNQLRAAGIEGRVIAEFVITTDGEADMSTFQVLKSDHEMFSAAVRVAVPKMRFRPATVNGVPVARKIDMPFQFSLVR